MTDPIDQDLAFIIRQVGQKRIGQRYIDNGYYELIDNRDDQVIEPEAFKVEAGVTLEISIIHQASGSLFDNQTRCPRCSFINPKSQASEWIQWYRVVLLDLITSDICFDSHQCQGKFQATATPPTAVVPATDPALKPNIRGGEEFSAEEDPIHHRNGSEITQR